MAKAVRFHETGGPDVLRVEDLAVGDPGPGEVRIRHAAVGCNFADTYFRSGYYPAQLPAGIGVEGAGTIEAVGAGVTGFAPGDRVAYNGSPLGAYSTARVMPAAPLFKLPDAISFEDAAASTMRGLSATYWLVKTNPRMKAGDTILLHAAAGGVGLLAVQLARLLGLRVIGTVSTEEKAERARAMGCDEIIFYRREDVAARVRELTDGEGVTTVFDSVGKDTFEGSLKSLKRRGLLVGCGTASGPFPPIDAFQLMMQGSVYFTRPGFADYYADPAERAELSALWFGHLAAGRIKVEIGQRYALDDCVAAHRALETGQTIGSSIFVL
ncbi:MULTISPECIES: quinone oxidoreductase [unclassified Sphingomonas]|uniref:quinone oxidoreductase family protein n=1 Tax=unclassified Sphingomonas TaxID=196159 RepID=UPI000926AD5C|nr:MULTISPECIES: quinone oxidoreductase [unclassified Sphingomonas]MBN8848293.1 quinone oxidoreductase [Sphingomonas sp.]MBN9015692.1 quinone oxidoreductase [Hyphomicrobiales bacterium]OJV33860.1 MAG: quinone oxidoreductase [Sphingomonas sp. 67-36]